MGVYTVKNTYHIADFYHSILNKMPLQLPHQFIIEFIAPIGQTGKVSAGDDAFGRRDYTDMQCVTYWAQSARIPELQIDEAKINFLANDFVVPTVIKYADNWQTEILLDQDLTQYKKLRAWENLISDFSKSGGGKKIIPNVQAKVSLLENTMQKIKHTYVMQGVWIQNLGNVGMAYEPGGATIQKVQCTFEYQYFYPADDLENPTASDPLSPAAVDIINSIQNLYSN